METYRNSPGRGFIDAHVHLSAPEGLDSVLAAGIIAIRHGGMKTELASADCFHSEKPVVISSCWALYKQGGYGARFGVPVNTKQDVKEEILKLKRSGADIIKVMASGMVSLKKPGTVTAGGFDREELRFIVEEAAALGLGVMAHANGEDAITAAAEAGVTSIEHGFFMTSRSLEAMAKKRIFWTPTLGALARAAEAAGEAVETKQFVSTLIRSQLAMVAQAHSSGVPLAVGTDCVLPDPGYGEAYDRELAYFEEAGLSCEEVMKIAYDDGARLLGLA